MDQDFFYIAIATSACFVAAFAKLYTVRRIKKLQARIARSRYANRSTQGEAKVAKARSNVNENRHSVLGARKTELIRRINQLEHDLQTYKLEEERHQRQAREALD